MAKFTKAELKKEYQRAKANDWIPAFIEAANDKKFPPEVLMGIASRETNMENIKGDFRGGIYHGYGLMQIDVGSYPDWIKSGAWHNPLEGIKKGAEVLAEKRREVANAAKASGQRLTEGALERISIAAYNCGASPAYKHWRSNTDPDESTTGKDYSQDVLARAEVFKSFLEADSPETLTTSPDNDPPATPQTEQGAGPGASGPASPQAEAKVVVAAQPEKSGALKSLWVTISGTVLAVLAWIWANIEKIFGIVKDNQIDATTVTKWAFIAIGGVVSMYLFRQLVLDAIRIASSTFLTHTEAQIAANPDLHDVKIASPAPKEGDA
jgi:hypothetical protein